MSESCVKFNDLVTKIEESGKFDQILKVQQLKYHLHPFKISGIGCEAIRKIYDSIQIRYQASSQSSQDPNSWNQNQRRVFIWFIIFYTYLQDISPTQITHDQWKQLSKMFFNKNPQFLQFQCLNMKKLQQKIAWTKQQDELLVAAVKEQGNGKWNQVAKKIFFKSNFTLFKSPKHCRERWLNHLDDKKKRGAMTPQEDLLIFEYVTQNGKHWCKIVPLLRDTRTEHMIKNRYNSLINRQRKSKKQREEHLRQKIVKILKKQIFNADAKKKLKQAAAQNNILKIETQTPEQKNIEEINATNSKQSLPNQITGQDLEIIQPQFSNPQDIQGYIEPSPYYLIPNDYYGFNYPQYPSYLYRPPYPVYQSMYWV